MSIIKFGIQGSQLEDDLRRIESPLTTLDSYLSLCAASLNEAMDVFWNLPDERIEAILNYYGPQQVEAIFAAHAEKAAMFNAILAARGLPPIARIGAAREIAVDPEPGVISLVPLPDPVIEEPAVTVP